MTVKHTDFKALGLQLKWKPNYVQAQVWHAHDVKLPVQPEENEPGISAKELIPWSIRTRREQTMRKLKGTIIRLSDPARSGKELESSHIVYVTNSNDELFLSHEVVPAQV